MGGNSRAVDRARRDRTARRPLRADRQSPRRGRAGLVLWDELITGCIARNRHYMREMTPLNEIRVPEPQPDEVYAARILDREVTFTGLKCLLGAADYSKAGDRQAGLAAGGEDVREAARTALSELTLAHLYDHPLTDDRGCVDS